MIKLASNVDQFISRDRRACWSWIQACDQPLTTISALTGIPRGRLQSLNLDEGDLQILARHIETTRPVLIDTEASLRLEQLDKHAVKATLKAKIDDERYRESFPDEWQATVDRYEDITIEITSLLELKRPLEEQWAGLSFVEQRRDLRERDCKRCGHVWNSRIAGEPVKCPRCQSAYWNQEAGVGGR